MDVEAQVEPAARKAPAGSTIAIVFLSIAILTAIIEFALGRSLLGPDGRFGLWEASIWSPETSQRVADPYSFSHIGHGLLFFGLLWLTAKRVPLGWRFLAAVALEAGWEILENSPLIINRYRDVTAAQGYTGDSILNSVSDLLMMSGGFWFASRVRWWWSSSLLLAMEIGCAWAVRDNLTLNVIMLTFPVEAIRDWQLAGRP